MRRNAHIKKRFRSTPAIGKKERAQDPKVQESANIKKPKMSRKVTHKKEPNFTCENLVLSDISEPLKDNGK